MISAEYQGGSNRIDSTPDPMTIEDMRAVKGMTHIHMAGWR